MSSAVLRAEQGTFYVELETRESGLVELVTSIGRERRVFRDPGQALKVLRALGVETGRFALQEWDPRAPKAKAWSRPDQSAQMKARHVRADEAAEFEKDVLEALAEADNPDVEKIAHDDAMAMLDAKLASLDRKPKRKARE
ncbi:hypothetical protein [Paraburkholderia sp.]|uniref:hypothetical protein n=1 Tax=Paraburkholderia sp. TaxID=1926495 RepID=UPI0023842A4D|nr:hypothetical protein [Paraburkholderia sp.]MDE1183789.1 hypothetical protein [Paraburkholderia sp.]